MPGAAHILLTRFNLPIADFDADRGGRPTRTAEWLEHRFALFRDVCVPSVAAQTCRDFRWVLLIDADGAAALRPRLEALLGGIDAVVLESVGATGWRPALHNLVSPRPDRLLVTRLDNDDALHPDFLRCANAMLEHHLAGRADYPAPPFVLNFSHGLCWDGKVFMRRALYHNAFTTWLVPRSEDDPAGFSPLPYDLNHNFVVDHYPVLDLRLQEPMWVQVVHRRNIRNRMNGAVLEALPTALEGAFGYLRAVRL